MRDDVMRMVVMTRGGRMELCLYGDCFLKRFAVGLVNYGSFLAGFDWSSCCNDYKRFDGWFLCMAGKQHV